jgi:hypothetical protein
MSTIQHNGVATGFVDVLCDDPEWLRAEFDDLIAAVWDEPPRQRPPGPPRRPDPVPRPPRPGSEYRHRGDVICINDAWPRQRSPPL